MEPCGLWRVYQDQSRSFFPYLSRFSRFPLTFPAGWPIEIITMLRMTVTNTLASPFRGSSVSGRRPSLLYPIRRRSPNHGGLSSSANMPAARGVVPHPSTPFLIFPGRVARCSPLETVSTSSSEAGHRRQRAGFLHAIQRPDRRLASSPSVQVRPPWRHPARSQRGRTGSFDSPGPLVADPAAENTPFAAIRGRDACGFPAERLIAAQGQGGPGRT